MSGHMSAFTNLILIFFRIPVYFQIVSSSMVAFLALPILALMSSEQLPVFLSSEILGFYLGYRFSINVNIYICIFVSY